MVSLQCLCVMPLTGQVCLISDVIQHFVDQKVDFDASYVYDDVKGSIDYIHRSGLLHKKILADPAKYLHKSVRSRCFDQCAHCLVRGILHYSFNLCCCASLLFFLSAIE